MGGRLWRRRWCAHEGLPRNGAFAGAFVVLADRALHEAYAVLELVLQEFLYLGDPVLPVHC